MLWFVFHGQGISDEEVELKVSGRDTAPHSDLSVGHQYRLFSFSYPIRIRKPSYPEVIQG